MWHSLIGVLERPVRAATDGRDDDSLAAPHGSAMMSVGPSRENR
jgi:hypothetical protein